MRTIFVSLIAVFALSVFGQEGVIGSAGKVSSDQQMASMADWYTAKAFGDISELGSVVTIATTWPGYLLKGFYNPRRDSSVYIHCITARGDTAKFSVATESFSGKLPIVAKIITATSSDSTIGLFQKR